MPASGRPYKGERQKRKDNKEEEEDTLRWLQVQGKRDIFVNFANVAVVKIKPFQM